MKIERPSNKEIIEREADKEVWTVCNGFDCSVKMKLEDARNLAKGDDKIVHDSTLIIVK